MDDSLPEAPAPMCGFCKPSLDPSTDVLYQGLGLGSGRMILYGGWCGAVLGGGVPPGPIQGSKRERG
jgi:hypothetical protein